MYCRAKETARDREAKGIDSEAREMRYMGGVLTFLLRGLYWAGILRDWMGNTIYENDIDMFTDPMNIPSKTSIAIIR